MKRPRDWPERETETEAGVAAGRRSDDATIDRAAPGRAAGR